MKSVNLGSAALAGFVGTLAMTALMYAAPLMGLPPMDLLAALGGMVPIGVSPYVVGALMHVAVGVTLALVYATLFERILPGPRWARGAVFSLLPWLFAITLMGPVMSWLQATTSPAEAQTLANPCGPGRPANPCSVKPSPPAANPCAIQPKPANPCAAVTPRPANPCAATAPGAEPVSPWLLRTMSLIAHLLYGAVVAVVYRPRT